MTAVRPLTSRRRFFSFWRWDDSGGSTVEREVEEYDRSGGGVEPLKNKRRHYCYVST